MNNQEKVERRREQRIRVKGVSVDIVMSMLIGGVGCVLTAGSVYFGVTAGWDSVIPGKGGGMTAATALIMSAVTDVVAAGVVYVIHRK